MANKLMDAIETKTEVQRAWYFEMTDEGGRIEWDLTTDVDMAISNGDLGNHRVATLRELKDVYPLSREFQEYDASFLVQEGIFKHSNGTWEQLETWESAIQNQDDYEFLD
ncbi:hypothetical protein FHR92_001038 [Fontibacillus solani]|uniref:Uncharacterized protein n=1 Tax=Fontibacillus solani TaxID=1572857 RepID=A0A7W3SQY1_9BACL|nr:hypothetical protein [Fontibacillus solani]MBA9084581.1 hypothetical protein [Fontibacillus solani]